MMDFGRFRYKTDDDIIVVMDDPVIRKEERKQDKNTHDLLEKLENAIESVIPNSEEKPSVKKINEDYHNEELMNKYLKGKGHFKKSYIDDYEEVVTIKKEVSLLEKYALNKESNKKEKVLTKYVLNNEPKVEEKVQKQVNENYEDKTLMTKYLKGKGIFNKAVEDKVEEENINKVNEDLLEKYALDKEEIINIDLEETLEPIKKEVIHVTMPKPVLEEDKTKNVDVKNDTEEIESVDLDNIEEPTEEVEDEIEVDIEEEVEIEPVDLDDELIENASSIIDEDNNEELQELDEVEEKIEENIETEEVEIEAVEVEKDTKEIESADLDNIEEPTEEIEEESTLEDNVELEEEVDIEAVDLDNTEEPTEEIEIETNVEIDEELEESLEDAMEDILTNTDNILVEEKPKFEKVINEDYQNKDLMKKYLKGKGHFIPATYEVEKKEYIIKKNEDLLVKYALDKVAVKPEVLHVEEEYVELDSIDIPDENEPLLEEVNDTEKEDMTPVELTDDIDAPILPEPASLTEIVEGSVKEELAAKIEEEVEISEVFSEPKVKTKIKKPNPVKPIAIILAFIMLGFTGTLYVYNSTNKVIVNKALKHIKNYTKYVGNNLSFDETGELSLLGDIIFISNDIEEDINDAKIKYDFKKTEKKRTLDLGLYKNERLNLATKINLSNNKGYVLFEDLYDKYIQLSDYSYSNEQLKNGEIEDLTSYFVTNFIKNINKEYYKSENAKIIIDGKNVSVKKTNLVLNDKQLVEIYNKTIDNIIASSYYSSILRKIVKEDVKLDINDLDSSNIKTYEISFYSSKILGKIKGIDFKVNYNIKKQICEFNIDNLINNNEKCEKTKIEEQEFSIQYRLSDNNKFVINDPEGDIINGEIIEKENEIVVNLGDKNNVNIGHARIYKIEDENIIEFSFNKDSDKLVLSLKYQIDEVKVNSEYNITISLDIETMDYTYEKKTLSINTILSMKNKVDKNQDYVSEYISSEDLTNSEVKSLREEIQNKVNNIFGRLEEE